MDSYLNEILKDKINEQAEIEIHFFEFCNFSCHFCGQDHDDRTGMDTIVEKSVQTNEFIRNSPMKHFIINMMGGELFNDEVPDELFQDYRDFAYEVDQYAKSLGKTCTFNWVTNLSFEKWGRVRHLLFDLKTQGLDTNISTSYDFTGRPVHTIKETIFYKNLERFKDYIYTVGFVLTKPSINFLLRRTDPFFDYLYQNYPLYFDYYVPERGSADTLMPSDRDQLNAFLHIAKYYPKVAPVCDWLKNERNKLTCYSTNKITILQDGREVKCRYMKYKPNDFITELDYSSNENIIEAHLDRWDCQSCEYYDKCSFTCFVQADWAAKERMDTCLYKEFYKEIESGSYS